MRIAIIINISQSSSPHHRCLKLHQKNREESSGGWGRRIQFLNIIATLDFGSFKGAKS
ncbi:hypothetical protein HanPSC8_Chr06g0243801 [Helianthus annuus]|nr:hypothetical protein HanPSC8_Chr06g0243801 [Helianthus annuus]